jgi:N-acetylmuramoyl-L-alanine amidase
MKRFIILIVVFSMVQGYFILAQENEMELIVKQQLSPEGKKKIAKAEKYIAACEMDKKEAEKLEGNQKKSLRKLISSSKNFGKANKIKYKVYRKDFEKFTNIEGNDSAKVIKKKMLSVKKNMKRSASKRDAALKLTRDDDVYSLLKHADEMETKAFKNIYYVYSLLIDKENIKKEKKITDPGSTNMSENIKGSTSIMDKEVAINDVNAQDVLNSGDNEINSGNVISQKVNENQNTELNENSNNITNKATEEENINSNVYFIIQIAASKTELSTDNLMKNFPTKEVLNIENVDGWYKYTINKKFVSYDEALQYKTNLKTKGTFIIAFKNGKKVSIEEALKKEPDENTIIVAKESEIEIPKPETAGKTVYKLQIGLSISPLSATEVSQFKNGGKEVFSFDCGSWIIYTIGDFDSESAALNFKKLKGLEEAEVVKFFNEKLVQE